MSSLSYHLNHSDHSVGGIMMQLYAATAADLLKAGIDINLPLKTIDGDPIRLIAYDGDHRYPLVGEVIDEGANIAWLARWSRSGRYFGTPEATKKHSMAVSVISDNTAGVMMHKVMTIDEFYRKYGTHTGRFSGATPNPAGSINGVVVDEVSSISLDGLKKAAQSMKDHAAPIKDGCYTVEPVHDMGLEEKAQFVPLQTAAQEFDTLADLRERLSFYKNAMPPIEPVRYVGVARSKEVASTHNGKSRRVRVYAKLLTYAAFGRFRWYANENQSLPLDCVEKIVKVLDETDLPFVYLRSPEIGVQNPEVFRKAVTFADMYGGSDAVIKSVVASAE